jgi:hypothetical protein
MLSQKSVVFAEFECAMISERLKAGREVVTGAFLG